jgi:predicted permease
MIHPESLWRDLLFAFRVLFKRPIMTLVAILALSLSIGMTITFFSVINGIMLRPMPFPEPEKLHSVYLTDTPGTFSQTVFSRNQIDIIASADIFESSGSFFSGTINVSGDGTPERFDGAFISGDLMKTLGMDPLLGRHMSNSADVADEILISHTIWKDRYRSDPRIIGSYVRANGDDRRIVGVMPEGFHFPQSAQAWLPHAAYINPSDSSAGIQLMPIARLRDGLSKAQIDEGLEDLNKRIHSLEDEQTRGMTLKLLRFGKISWNSASLYFLIFTSSAVIFILVISCANVANLMIGQAASRGREMAIRCALGASRRRIALQILMESSVLAILATIGGFLYAAWAIDKSWDTQIWNLPYWINFQIDLKVVAFALGLMVFTALVAGILPAWQASRTDLNEMLKETNTSSNSFRLGRFTRMLTITQIAFAVALLFASGLTMMMVINVYRSDPGYPPEQILTMRMGLFAGDYPTKQSRDQFYSQLTQAVAAQPGVDSAAISSWIARIGNMKVPFRIENDDLRSPANLPYSNFESISPEYLKVMDSAVISGRGFLATDQLDSTPVILINNAFARQYLNGNNAVGTRLSLIIDKLGTGSPEPMPHTIVGVVSDIKVTGFNETTTIEPTIYFPYTQTNSQFMTLMVRSTGGDSAALFPSIQSEILKLDPHLPVYFITTMQDFIYDQVMPFRMLAEMFTEIGLLALFLAAVSVYGMIAFNVTQRRQEFGIRMALGANVRNILHLVLRQGILQFLFGMSIGTGLAALIGVVAHNFLVGTMVFDYRIYIAVITILGLVAALAFYLPTRRATRLSPMQALRYE